MAMMSLLHGCEHERQEQGDNTEMTNLLCLNISLPTKGKGFKVFIYFDGEILFIYLFIYFENIGYFELVYTKPFMARN
jgi:hypothetical protein